jgi:hypothetical protein
MNTLGFTDVVSSPSNPSSARVQKDTACGCLHVHFFPESVLVRSEPRRGGGRPGPTTFRGGTLHAAATGTTALL